MIDQGAVVEIKKAVFTTGDSYLVVDEAAEKIYIWLGSKCSVDEKATAAIEARRIDDSELFNGNAKIVTYDQGDESPEFLSKLQGLKIINKNLAKTMLIDVKTGEFAGQSEHVNALYRISSEEFDGLNAIKFVQVDFEKKALDSEDCFIADLGVDIWIWQGSKSNVKEKVKAIQFAREFDADRAGGQRPEVFMENDGDEKFMGIFEGKLPTQDRKTVDLKAEAFDDDGKKPEPKAESKPEPKKESKPEPKKEVKAESKPQSSASAPAGGGKSMLVQSGGGRLKCPKCGNVSRNMIREMPDRNHIIMDYPVMYGKKYVCGKCGSEWRREE
jgi:Gelsolin repeat